MSNAFQSRQTHGGVPRLSVMVGPIYMTGNPSCHAGIRWCLQQSALLVPAQVCAIWNKSSGDSSDQSAVIVDIQVSSRMSWIPEQGGVQTEILWQTRQQICLWWLSEIVWVFPSECWRGSWDQWDYPVLTSQTGVQLCPSLSGSMSLSQVWHVSERRV